jgi:hypothetical protein
MFLMLDLMHEEKGARLEGKIVQPTLVQEQLSSTFVVKYLSCVKIISSDCTIDTRVSSLHVWNCCEEIAKHCMQISRTKLPTQLNGRSIVHRDRLI